MAGKQVATARSQWAWTFGIGLLLAACIVGWGVAAEKAPQKIDQRIAALIEQLGNQDYFVRERAQESLAQIGFEAFDALCQAENHPDVEVASRSQYLVRLIRIDWIASNDSPEVRTLLQKYESSDDKTRLAVIGDLAKLPDNKGLAVLCRLVRFEKSQPLAKQAALRVLEQGPIDDSSWPAREKAILQGIGESPRAAAEWLRVSLLAHKDPTAGLAAWRKLAETEAKTLSEAPAQSRPELVMALWRQLAGLAKKLDRREEATAAMLKVVSLEQGSTESLSELLEWLVAQQAWTMIDELVEKFGDRFEQDPLLLYTLAQTRLTQGNEEAAKQIGARAEKLNAEDPVKHLQLAQVLQEKGLIRWALREYRVGIEIGPAGQRVALVGLRYLSELLHDQGDELAAAQALEDASKAIDANVKAGNNAANGGIEVESLRSRMHYFFACHYAGLKNRDKQVEHLTKGIEQDPTDADVLIGLYRIPDLEPELRDKTRRLIREAADLFRQVIQQDPDNSTGYNQLAWLVSNTEGDKTEALRCSQKSLELKPNEAGHLDTLGRCYYALGDYANAVKYQSKAVELQPHSGQMTRQLELFQEALAKAKPRPSTP